MTELNPSLTSVVQAAQAEALFHPSEVFYSRTDERGVILSGNSVFHRLSGYEWDELIGAPHKLVRHPDMPKAVYHLLWERLKDGKPTGAYIKNRTKCGKFYWVLGLAAPLEDGFFSIRLKPGSALFAQVQALYEDLVKREREDNLTPAEGAKQLTAALADMGFSSYDAFQSQAVAIEQQSRAKLLGQKLLPLQARLVEMSQAIEQVLAETMELTEAFQSIRTVPMNMRIIATRLQSAGGPIGAISVNYSQMLEDMSAWVATFVDGEDCVFARMQSAVSHSRFFGFVHGLEKEMIETFRRLDKDHPETVDIDAEIARLETHCGHYVAQANDALTKIEQEAKRFGRSVLDMKRYVTGLSSTRMMCKIESASLLNSGTSLAGVVDQLDAGQNEIEQRLARVIELNSVIQSNTSLLRTLL